MLCLAAFDSCSTGHDEAVGLVGGVVGGLHAPAFCVDETGMALLETSELILASAGVAIVLGPQLLSIEISHDQSSLRVRAPVVLAQPVLERTLLVTTEHISIRGDRHIVDLAFAKERLTSVEDLLSIPTVQFEQGSSSADKSHNITNFIDTEGLY